MNSDRMFSATVPLMRSTTVRRIQRRRRELFDAMPPPQGRVVFLGDSITQAGPWDELFPHLPTVNRGVGGDTTIDLGSRLDAAIQSPLLVSLMIGTNDLHGPRQFRDITGIATRTDDIVRRIRHLAPDAPLLISSVLPRTALFAERIQQLNDHYRDVAANHNATFLDLWPSYADKEGNIIQDLTKDNLHLTPAGYLPWAQVLRPHLIPIGGLPTPH